MTKNKYYWIHITEKKLQEIPNLPDNWKFYQVNKYLNSKKYFNITKNSENVIITEENDKVREHEIFWVKDHINYSGSNPLIGKNNEKYGQRFPDMSFPYVVDDRIKEVININSSKKIVIAAGIVNYDGAILLNTPNMVYQAIIANHQEKTFYGFIISNNNGINNFLKLIKTNY